MGDSPPADATGTRPSHEPAARQWDRARAEARRLLERVAHSQALSGRPVRAGWVEARLDRVTEQMLTDRGPGPRDD